MTDQAGVNLSCAKVLMSNRIDVGFWRKLARRVVKVDDGLCGRDWLGWRQRDASFVRIDFFGAFRGRHSFGEVLFLGLSLLRNGFDVGNDLGTSFGRHTDNDVNDCGKARLPYLALFEICVVAASRRTILQILINSCRVLLFLGSKRMG
jgi:hypothetical protein